MERTLQEIMSKSDKKPAGGTSSEEMEARVSARKARQRVERAKSAQRRAPMTSYGRLAATAAAAVIAVGSFIYGQATSSTYESELAEGSTRIAELRDEINRASSEVESMPSAQQMGASLSAAAERGALDVDAGAEDDGDLLLDAFLAHGFADLADEFGVPGAGQACGGREASCGHGGVEVGFAGVGCQRLAQAVGAVGDHVAGDAFGFDALQMPGVAAGGQGRLLFERQVVDGRVGVVAHSASFCLSRDSLRRYPIHLRITTDRLVGTLSKRSLRHANHP